MAVLILAFAALMLRDASLPHRHDGVTPGLYNHDHDLCTLATVAGGLVPQSPEPGPTLVVLAPTAVVVDAVRVHAPRFLAAPRAPPHPEPPRFS